MQASHEPADAWIRHLGHRHDRRVPRPGPRRDPGREARRGLQPHAGQGRGVRREARLRGGGDPRGDARPARRPRGLPLHAERRPPRAGDRLRQGRQACRRREAARGHARPLRRAHRGLRQGRRGPRGDPAPPLRRRRGRAQGRARGGPLRAAHDGGRAHPLVAHSGLLRFRRLARHLPSRRRRRAHEPGHPHHRPAALADGPGEARLGHRRTDGARGRGGRGRGRRLDRVRRRRARDARRLDGLLVLVGLPGRDPHPRHEGLGGAARRQALRLRLRSSPARRRRARGPRRGWRRRGR